MLLRTDRLLLRCYRPGDAAGILALVQQNREQLLREFGQQAGLQSVEQASDFATQKIEQWNRGESLCYGIWRGDSPQQVGQIQAKHIMWQVPSAELGYFIAASAQHQGYAGESIGKILSVAFQEFAFERIFVRILPSNAASLGLAKKLGFQEEGVQRRAFRCGRGELHDVQVLAMTREDYRRMHR